MGVGAYREKSFVHVTYMCVYMRTILKCGVGAYLGEYGSNRCGVTVGARAQHV